MFSGACAQTRDVTRPLPEVCVQRTNHVWCVGENSTQQDSAHGIPLCNITGCYLDQMDQQFAVSMCRSLVSYLVYLLTCCFYCLSQVLVQKKKKILVLQLGQMFFDHRLHCVFSQICDQQSSPGFLEDQLNNMTATALDNNRRFRLLYTTHCLARDVCPLTSYKNQQKYM